MGAGRGTLRSSWSPPSRRSGFPRRVTRRARSLARSRRNRRPRSPRNPCPIDTLSTGLLRRARGSSNHGPQGGSRMRRRSIPVGIVLVALAMACHREVEMTPLIERTIYPTDRFYDVQAVSKDRAVVVGYGGKVLETRDRGRNWTVLSSGTDVALYGVHFVKHDRGWIVGQDGLVLATSDGGKSWTTQEANARLGEGDGAGEGAHRF